MCSQGSDGSFSLSETSVEMSGQACLQSANAINAMVMLNIARSLWGTKRSSYVVYTLMVAFHTRNWIEDDGGMVGYNMINGIGAGNKNKTIYHDKSNEYFKDYPSLINNYISEEINAIYEDIGAWWKVK